VIELNSRIILILISLILLGCVHAETQDIIIDTMNITPTTTETEISIDEFTFRIPAGYVQKNYYNNTNEMNLTTIHYTFTDNQTNLITVTVMFDSTEDTSDDILSFLFPDISRKHPRPVIKAEDLKNDSNTYKIIGETEGIYESSDNIVDFIYIKDNKAVYLTAPNDETIEFMLK
jgi:hypothetical protein